MSSDECTMQYYYPTEELSKKYKIDCSGENFVDYDNIEKFNNENFLKYVNENYGDKAFPDNSPFTFDKDYIKSTNNDICNIKDYSLKPQQKFMGQFINPSTNINSSLVFHGLGSGKTCTSLVIGEAFKTKSVTKLLYVVPAPLVDQVRDEILGELKIYNEDELKEGKKPEIWGCTSQCIINGKRDFYTNIADKYKLKEIENKYETIKKELGDLILNNDVETIEFKNKVFFLQNELKRTKAALNNMTDYLLGKVTKTFQIISHISFINKLFVETKDGTWIKKDFLSGIDNKGKKFESPLLSSSGILVIDEIQRLVSEGGILYKKLFTAIYQYMNPKARIILLSATPIYDNPYELALTMNLLRPRMLFPLKKETFYSFFLGKYDDNDNRIRVKVNNYITNDSCLINKNLLRILTSGYVSYFRGGNPNAYPYKRIIVMEHKMASNQKEQYIESLKSDIKKDSSMYSKLLKGDEFLLKQPLSKKEDAVSGIYVKTQQYSNIALPITKSDLIDNILSSKGETKIKNRLDTFKTELKQLNTNNSEIVLNFIREKGYSEKFVSIINLSLNCNGPVFIFSNWLHFGVEALSIILDSCGFKKYPEKAGPSGLRYFVWSSETSNDKELISKAKNTFNSMENKDGSLIKIILGTRSIMEGVSFKNVKQVHITDPWWNETRIEQILARAVRFCSHSNLQQNEQYTDIFRHYTVLPMVPDPQVSEMIKDTIGYSNYKDFDSISIEQKMVMSALKKHEINNEFEKVLKEVAYDCDLNTNGNIIRLEENIIPLQNGKYLIYFKNTKTLEIYAREGIPKEVTFEEVLNRKYSFPNDSTLKVKFYEIEIEGENYKIIENTDNPESTVLQEPIIDKKLNMYENIKCWNSDLTLENIFNKMKEQKRTGVSDDTDIIKYFMRLKENFKLLPTIRKNILGEKTLSKSIKFENIDKTKGKNKLLKCLNSLSESNLTPEIQKKQIKKMLLSLTSSIKINKKIFDIIYKYNLFPENMIEELQNLTTEDLNKLLQEAEYIHSVNNKSNETK